jgi:hypothetical protein
MRHQRRGAECECGSGEGVFDERRAGEEAVQAKVPAAEWEGERRRCNCGGTKLEGRRVENQVSGWWWWWWEVTPPSGYFRPKTRRQRHQKGDSPVVAKRLTHHQPAVTLICRHAHQQTARESAAEKEKKKEKFIAAACHGRGKTHVHTSHPPGADSPPRTSRCHSTEHTSTPHFYAVFVDALIPFRLQEE